MEQHDMYWTKVCVRAHGDLDEIFRGSGTSVAELVGDRNGIDSMEDAKCVLAYVLEHGDSRDVAHAVLAVCEILVAHHELHENAPILKKVRDISAAGAAE